MSDLEKIIMVATFMGMQKTDLGWFDSEEVLNLDGTDNTFDILEFDSNWNWLMAVVKEIAYSKYAGGITYDVQEHLLVGDIEKTFEAVVTFIEWYNSRENK